MMNDRPEPREPRSVSFESGHDGRVLMKIWVEDMTSEQFMLEPDIYLDMVRGLGNVAAYAVGEAVRAIKKGDCATCRNFALVEKEHPNGRKEMVHCPDCSDGSIETFARPRHGGGVR
jgi:hypothetical protein